MAMSMHALEKIVPRASYHKVSIQEMFDLVSRAERECGSCADCAVKLKHIPYTQRSPKSGEDFWSVIRRNNRGEIFTVTVLLQPSHWIPTRDSFNCGGGIYDLTNGRAYRID